jgi:hypothetical protein
MMEGAMASTQQAICSVRCEHDFVRIDHGGIWESCRYCFLVTRHGQQLCSICAKPSELLIATYSPELGYCHECARHRDPQDLELADGERAVISVKPFIVPIRNGVLTRVGPNGQVHEYASEEKHHGFH